jgi:RNA polymerase sigma-70 factor (ECF subfamily)
MLLRRCLFYVKNRPDAEDITHAVFVKAIEKWELFRKEAAPYTWFYRIATNLCLNHLRDHRREIFVDKETVDTLIGACCDDFDLPMKRIIIDEMLSGFCDTTKRIIFLSSFERLSQEEIGVVLGLSRKIVQTKWNRFIEKARKRLKEDV